MQPAVEPPIPNDPEKQFRRGTASSGMSLATTESTVSPETSSQSSDEDRYPTTELAHHVSESEDNSSDYCSDDSEDSSAGESADESLDSEEVDTFEVNDEKFRLPHSACNFATPMEGVDGQEQEEDDDDDDDESDDDDDDDDDDDSSSNYSSEDFSESMVSGEFSSGSEDDSEYDDLMATLPIALGRVGGPVSIPPPAQPQSPKTAVASSMGLPLALASMQPEAVANEGGNPLEGLALLQNIRSELEQVGRLIVAKKTGEKFLQRAHILASINWLATNVPACVLDHLGQEIRRNLENAQQADPVTPEDVHLMDDSSSDASDLSDMDLSESGEFDFDVDFMGFSTPRATPRFRPGSNADPLSSSAHNPTRALPKRAVSRSTSESRLAVNNQYQRRGVARTTSALSHESNRTQSAKNATRRMSMCSTFSFREEKKEEGNLPAVSYFQCALLFVDISGFTKLSTLLDPENLSKVINSYFQAIVQKVFDFHGDIQKFAGDALFAEWRVTPTTSLAQCVEAAAACASNLARDCGDFPVMAFGGVNGGVPLTHLNVHCGLGVGEMAGVHIGDNKLRREYVYIGNPILQATKACEQAKLGQVVASRKVFNVLSWSGVIDEPFALQGKEYFMITDRGETKLDEKKLALYSLGARNAKSRGVTDHVDGLETDALIEYRRLMSLYVHPVVVSNDVAASDDFRSSRAHTASQERHREDAELRSVYVMFINPKVPVDLSGDDYLESAHRLNDILTLTTRELARYNGHMRQLIVDDKGLVLIATFGLRGSTFPNMVAERALPATMVIHNALQMELGVESRIGATFGDVYCGPVGGVKRNEYAVMGPSVNLAARLMTSKENPGILVDHAVRKLASRTYSFNALSPVSAKGYKEPVRIFEPLTELERSWGKIEPNFVGRQDEIKKIMGLAKEMAWSDRADPKLVIISSSSGMGKSTLLAHSIEHVRKMLGPVARRLLITRDVGKESDASVPFKTIRPILLKVLNCFADRNNNSHCDGRSVVSGAISQAGSTSYFQDSCTIVTQASSKAPSVSQAADVLVSVSASLEVRSSLIELVRRIVLQGPTSAEIKGWNVSAPALKEIAGFITRLIRKCTEDMKLTVIALDNLHHADPASWLVLRQIFETADNVLMIGTSFSTADSTFRVERDFWQELNDSYTKNGRFVRTEIGNLSPSDLELMTMKALGISKQDVSKETLHEVVVQSGGMPHFANKILQGIKERISSGSIETFSEHDESISEIILHRVDTFDLNLRNTLNVGAVLGEQFLSLDVLSVLKDSSDTKEADLRQQISDSLSLAVKEGILCVSKGTALDSEDVVLLDDETILTFRHSVWRSTLLGLMLDARKRDVHRKIATAMEKAMNESSSHIFKSKLFNHWKNAGDTSRATTAALIAGRDLQEAVRCSPETISLYKEALCMWGWDTAATEHVGGFSKQVLHHSTPTDQSNILRLTVALGRAYVAAERHHEGVKTYEDALCVMKAAEISSKLEDRSIVFPAFVGLATALGVGHIQQDVHRRYEQTLLRRFIEDTRKHGRLIHHIYALYLQMQFYGGQDEVEKAIAVQSMIKKIYKPDRHSQGLRNVYGIDAGALSYSLAAFYELAKGSSRQALRSCRQVLKEVIPKVKSDYNQAFSLMYPLAVVLKEGGFSAEACAFYEKVVTVPYGDKHNVYECLRILFALTSKNGVSEDAISEFADWASNRENLLHDERVNMITGKLGRCADTLSAEICFLVAAQLPASRRKVNLIDYGKQLVSQATIFHRKHGNAIARKQAQSILTKLRLLNGNDGD